ncbi:MAG: hypothetical protein BWK73_41050 [Thiothrix lacustris]|uniref:SD-repeat containing protein B domain-containing protein n=1 Tax=Thiothrix lacustris TaxID=525917 RepID=A0A1Y1QD47_9GAMM|nr:MAG: hypothetical protein BWK73_41050 [Thiothrix lacustris]
MSIAWVVLAAQSSWADTTGKAFSDFDGDGVQDAGEVGRAGIIVKAFKVGSTAEVATATTDATGAYSLVVSAAEYPVRLEFSFPTDTCGLDSALDFPAANGDKYGTSVQFANVDGETHNFIFNYPADFSTENNPRVFLPKMINGDPLAGGDAGNAPAVVSFHYQDTGIAANSERGGGAAPAYEIAAIQKQVGSVYGNAYSRQAKKVFVSAFMKRHSGMGPLGGGGIYMLGAEPPFDTTASVNFVDLDAIGIATSDEAGVYTSNVSPDGLTVQYSPVIGTNAQRGLPAGRATPNNDPLAYTQVGKLSLGDIDISEDGRYLYVVNLYDKKLYQLDLTDALNPTAPTLAKTQGFAIPNACTTNGGAARPFALKIARGKAYVGVTCSGEDDSGNATGGTADMTGSIHELDLKTQQWNSTPLISFTFDYRTDPVWYPWRSTTWDGTGEAGQPLISDIELDNGGNFIIGIMDVRGHRHGHNNYILSGTDLNSIATTGETLSAKRDTSVKTCKYNIQTTPEFYNDNHQHPESSQGALAVHHTADNDQVMTTFMDPIGTWSAGTHLYNNQTGARVNDGYEVYYSANPTDPGPANFGKAAGLGDLETVEVVPSVEIGNRVWLDLNSDGIQDGNEAGIDNVNVTLKCGAGEATTQTKDGGQFYFSNVAGGNATFMDVGESCKVTVASAGQTPLDGLSVTKQNADSITDNNAATDLRDSDATPEGEIAFTVGNAGENNHTLDIGYKSAPVNTDLKLTKTASKLTVKRSDTLSYLLILENTSDVNATGVAVNDKLPAGVTYVDHLPVTAIYDKTSGDWNVGTVPAKTTVTLTINVTVD